MSDRSTVMYRVVFLPEHGVDFEPTLIAEVEGSERAYDAGYDYLQAQIDDGSFCSAYQQFVDEGRETLTAFKLGEKSVAAINVPYGTLVIG